MTFIKECRRRIPQMLELFPHLVNYVDARHVISVRWLKRMGFHFDPDPVPYGPFGMDFYRFYKDKE